MKIHLAFSTGIVVSLVLGVMTVPAASAQTSMRQIDAETVRITDFQGKPPYKRRYVPVDELTVAQFARFEEIEPDGAVDGTRSGDKVMVIKRHGKPPFKRTFENID